MQELIIIGGGPAGMTAAVYAARKKISTLLIARNIGGQVITTSSVENYMGYQYVEGIDLMSKFEDQIKQFPIERNIGEDVLAVSRLESGFEVKTKSDERYQAKAIIVATGKMPRRLNVPGEERLVGRGVSYCSVCDGPLFGGEVVAVIGGGNSAFEAIADMLKIATHVFAIAESTCTCDAVLLDRVKNNPKLTLLENHLVQEIQGSARVEGIVVQDLIKRENKSLAVGGIFIEIGLTPNSELVKGLVNLNSSGEIEVNCRCETNVPGLFAAGDVSNIPEKQIIIAAGEGAKAALQADRYLRGII
jgi:alkyl hydroperoxide reductase subunit F